MLIFKNPAFERGFSLQKKCDTHLATRCLIKFYVHFQSHLAIFKRGWNWKGFRKKVSLVNLRMYMKHQFLKSALILSSVLAFMNCSEEAANALDNLDPAANQPTESNPSPVAADDACWIFNAGQDLLIYPIGIVTDAAGNVIGSFENGNITALDGTPIAVGIDVNDLTVTTRQELNATVPASSDAAAILNPASSANTVVTTSSESSSLPGVSSAAVQNPASSNAVSQTSSDSKQESSSSQQQQTVGNLTVTGNLTQTVAKGQTISPITFTPVNEKPKVGNDGQYWFLKFEYDQGSKKFTISGGEQFQYFPEKKISQQFTVDGQSFTLSLTLDEKATAQSSNSQQQAKSSSSQQQQQKSSSSQQQQQPKSSSSQQQQQPKSSSSQQGGSTPNFSIKAGGRSGSGWGSRYWDCCKPHCAWSGKGGPIAKTCNASQQTLAKGDDMVKSICDGGPAGLCNSQAPFAINDDLAYAFAAGPGNSYAGSCGSCFLLTFTGESRHTTDARTQALKGKKMVIMISNIGYDVEDGQFDMMIPGGGVGAFNGCSALWGINNLGAQHGGFLKDCGGDKKVTDVATVQKCLEDKCNSVFASIPDAKAGCLFHAQWLMAANNPSFTYQELEKCPAELEAKY